MISVAAYHHLGDSLCLMCAIANARKALPDADIRYFGDYGEILAGTDIPRTDQHPQIRCHYKDFGDSEQTASAGNLCSGLTLSLARHLKAQIPFVVKAPPVTLQSNESHMLPGAVLVNTNCQMNSTTKGYPWWSEVLEGLSGTVVLVGGRETRDIRTDFKYIPSNVIDLRGKTGVRELFRLVAGASCVISPPSGIVHLSAGFCVPCVVLSGAREPAALTTYCNTTHLMSKCPMDDKLDGFRGCVAFRVGQNEGCKCVVNKGSRNYAGCMASIAPDDVLMAVTEILRQG